MTTITVSEWVAAMESALSRAGDEGLTTQELADALHISQASMQEKLRALHRQGRLISGRSPRLSMDGRNMMLPVYRLKA